MAHAISIVYTVLWYYNVLSNSKKTMVHPKIWLYQFNYDL